MAYRFVNENEFTTIDVGDGDWVKIPARLSYGFVAQFEDVKEGTNVKQLDKIAGMLAQCIKDWNFKMENDEVAPINKEMISKLEIPTVKLIVGEITSLMGVEKKG